MDVAGSALGTPLAAPVAIAPTTLQRHAHDDGEVEMARGAAAAGRWSASRATPAARSRTSPPRGAPWWVQVYVLQDRRLTESLLARAVAAGARAVVLTADTPVVATKRELGADETVWDVTPDIFLHANEPTGGARPHEPGEGD